MADNPKEKLFQEFPQVPTEKWEEVIKKDLKGADYEKKLVWKTLEGIKVRPYYREEDLKNLPHLSVMPGEFPYVRGVRQESNDWFIRQDIIVKNNVTDANAFALDALIKGATSIGFVFDEAHVVKEGDVKQLLKDVCIAAAEINYIIQGAPVEILRQADRENSDRGGTLSHLQGSVEFDPLGYMAVTGAFPGEIEDPFETAALLVKEAEKLPNFTVLTVNGKHFHNAGASLVQELAFALSAVNEYIQKLDDKGVSPEEAAPNIRLSFAAGPNYFMEIAKFRAARILWSKILEAWNVPADIAGRMHIHATNSAWNKTVYDPYVNMLRATTESMSAVIGGINSFTAEPFDKPFKKEATGFGQRIARNTQLILKEEAYFDKIVDPGGGSYYIENLTTSIMEEAWKLFLETEDKGGFSESLKSDFIQERVEESAAQRDKNIATRREVLLGTNHFPNSSEKVSGNIDEGVEWPAQAAADKAMVRPIRLYRGATAFEEMRLKTERSSRGTPRVFLLTIGNLAMRKARAGFAFSFFGCAGFEVIDNLGFGSAAEGAEAALKSKSDIVVVCSSDEEYPEFVPEIAEKTGDKAILTVAGYPKDSLEELEKAGVRHFIHIKSNVLETLKQFQKELGIE